MEGNSNLKNSTQPTLTESRNPQFPAFQPSDEKKLGRKRHLVKLIIIIVLIVLLGGILAGVYFFIRVTNNQSNKIESKSEVLKNKVATLPAQEHEASELSLDEISIDELQQNEIVAAHNAFGFDLFKKFSESSMVNTNFSPVSIVVALSQMYQGADEKTLSQMQEVLHYKNLTKPEINAGIKYILNSFAENPLSNYGGFTLKVANSLWISKTSGNLNPKFSTMLQKYYYSKSYSEDFNNPQTVNKINTWVSNATDARIKSILEKLSSHSPFILANAVYFDAAWTNKFDKDETTYRDFTLTNGTVKKVQTMHQALITDYYEDEDVQTIVLPYGEGDAQMIVILPKKSFSLFLSGFTEDRFKKLIAGLEYSRVNFYFPKFVFEYDSKQTLKNSLKNLGMIDAFLLPDSNFDLIAKDIYISEILHKATIEVSEDGTVAAAATAVIPPAGGGSDDIKEYTMDVNRPFVYIITHRKTKEILFMGYVIDPNP